MLFSYEVVLSWKSHQSVFNTLLQEHYLRNSLAVKVLPLDLLPTGKIVSQPAIRDRHDRVPDSGSDAVLGHGGLG